MGKIKFRVWDKEAKVMSTAKIEYFDDMFGFRFRHRDLDEEDASDIEIMQYVRLHDDRGTEIYEGDILLSSNECGTFLQLIGFGSSDREYDSMLTGFKIIDGCILENDDYELTECKPLTQELVKRHNIPVIQSENIIMNGWWIIGNKYENPELLELFKK